MRKEVWMTTAGLVCLAAVAAVVEGCIDDGVGSPPDNLFTINYGDAATGDPGVTSESTPSSTTPTTPGTDSGSGVMDSGRKQPQDSGKPPTDSGSTMDSGDTADSGADAEAGT